MDEDYDMDEFDREEDLDGLSDEEQDAYESGYHTGFGAGGGGN